MQAKIPIKWECPYHALAFRGVPYKSNVSIMPTKSCIFSFRGDGGVSERASTESFLGVCSRVFLSVDPVKMTPAKDLL